jgi:acetoin utilization protein AcuB
MKQYRVADIFTRAVFALKPQDSIAAARCAMDRLAVRHIPVVDHEHKLIGMISDRDILLHSIPDELEGHRVEEGLVGDIMKLQPICCRATDKVHDAVTLMIDHRINSLPIKDHQGVLVGLVTSTDVLRLVRDSAYTLPDSISLNFLECTQGPSNRL